MLFSNGSSDINNTLINRINRMKQKFAKINLKKYIYCDQHHYGHKISPSYRDYRSSKPELRDPHISSLMSVNPFSWLLAKLYLNDNSTMPKKRANRTSTNYIKSSPI
jgi:hypothetical protein